jgi:hypothetical protein
MLLVVVSYRSWIRLAGKLRGSIAILMVAVSSIGIGYGAYPELDDILLNIQVPRVKNMQLQGGTTEVFRVLMNKFGWSYDFVQQLLPTIAGAGFGILLLLGPWFYFSRKNSSHSMSYGVASLQVFLLWGLIFTPSPIMSGSRFSTLCEGDVIASHEAAGKILSKQIPPGSLVYWQNDVSPLPLLYLPDIRVFPPQLNHWYTYLQGGEPDLLERAGFWNAELASQWKLEADYLLIAERYVNSIFPGGGVDGITFDELTPTQDTVPCRPRSIIHIYRRIR